MNLTERSNNLRGQTIAIAGSLNHRPVEDVIRLINNHGGNYAQQVKQGVTVVISTEEMAFNYENPYKLQFMPSLQKDIETAQMYSIPVVTDNWLDESLIAKRLLPHSDYLIQGFLLDVEAKFGVQKGAQSSLDPRVQQIVSMLFDQNEIDRSLVDLGVDVRQIANVTEKSIKDAWNVLKSIESQLQPSPVQTKAQHEAELSRVSNSFYALIPHRAGTPVIKTTEQIKEKSALLEALTDIEIANRLIKQKGSDADLNMSPLDINYRKLRCEITPLEQYRFEYQMIKEMVENTQSQQFDFKIELEEIFELKRIGETERFAPYTKLPHHRLLWHGSRLSNYIGLLSQGIRIAPPEAPVTGYFLGKGAYFADMVSVSGQYLKTTKQHPVGLMLLCDVALGRTFQLAHGKFIGKDDLDGAGFHSVKCCGTLGPDSGYDTQTNDNLIVSVGREVPTGVPVSELVHNEIVVYDAAQINMRYLVKVRFNHSK